VARTQIDLPHSSLHIDADRALMEGVLINLIKNAAEALAEKAAAISLAGEDDDEVPLITVSVEMRGQEGVAIVVEDNGPGVAQENVDRLFKTYFTTKTSSGGTGLGLAIVRETVQQHGGRVDVVSALGEGTRFTIELPISGCTLEEAGHPQSGERGNSVIRLASTR
jgi:signal transduction histidine kinase